jgi:hypothetical protein
MILRGSQKKIRHHKFLLSKICAIFSILTLPDYWRRPWVTIRVAQVTCCTETMLAFSLGRCCRLILLEVLKDIVAVGFGKFTLL